MAVRFQDSMASLDALEKGVHEDFADRTLRAGFMKKVFGLLTAQLALTTVLGALCMSSAVVQRFASHPVVVCISVLGSLAIILAFTISEKARSSHPTNLVLLLAFTLCEGLLVGLATARFPADLVITALGLTVAVSSGLTLYALRTKHDYTSMGGFLSAMALSFLSCILLGLVFHVPISSLLISLCGAALFSAYLVYDIQLVVGGAHHQYKLSPDDFVLATITIYLDLVNLFLYILRILSEMRRD